MRFRFGLLVGFGLGYYFGARAGRERYEQIEAFLDRLRATDAYRDARGRLSIGLRESTAAARRMIDDAVADDDDRPSTREQGPRSRVGGDPTLN